MPSASRRRRSSSWSSIEPAAAEEPNSERPKRAPSSSAQLTSRIVTGGLPSSAIRRSTSSPALTLGAPSSQPPLGTESMCPPISSARSESPGSVNHWLPAASQVFSTGSSETFLSSHLRAVDHVSVQATRWAPSESPVSSRSSFSSATVRLGDNAMPARINSKPMAVLIKGGRIVTAADDYAGDIYVEDETITLIGADLDQPADKTIDATGKYVLPGAVDPHTHLDMPFGGTVTIDDVESGQTAAAFGGTTTHVDFIIQPQGATFAQALEEWRAKANGVQVIDMGYHMAVTDLNEGGTLEELATLPDEGITSYKLFMAYKGALMVDDETLFRTMEVAAETGALVMVHAEDGDAIDVLVKQALAKGQTEPKYHALTRPPETEGEATNRAIQLARVAGCNLYVVHVSCAESVEPIQLAREKGWNVHGETCTQYFFVDETFLERPNFEGAKYVYTPPPRAKANQDVLWNAVRTDTLSAISTDHCAFRWDGQKTMGKDDFSKIPNGGPGLENRLHMIHEFGARRGRISLNRMVELLATSPAKLFGLYPKKGTVAVGSDADVVIFDPERKHTITAAGQHSKTDYNLYEGTEVTGTPEVVLLRGNVLVENDELVAAPGIGRFVPRARVGQELRSTSAVA